MFTVYSFINWQFPSSSPSLTESQEAMNRNKNSHGTNKLYSISLKQAAPNSFKLFIP